jgi:hypothetical protein
VDNHKNSMAGTTLIVELNQGDKVQVKLVADGSQSFLVDPC